MKPLDDFAGEITIFIGATDFAESTAAYRDSESLLVFGDPGLKPLADFLIRRRRVFDVVESHSRESRFNPAVRTDKTLLGKKVLPFN